MFSLAMVAFAYFISTVAAHSQTAAVVGIVLFIFGMLFQSIVFTEPFVGYIWWGRQTPKVLLWVLQALPFFNFGRALMDIQAVAAGKFNKLTETLKPGQCASMDAFGVCMSFLSHVVYS